MVRWVDFVSATLLPVEYFPATMGHHRPTQALIDLRALAGNLKAIRARIPNDVKVLAVVKANGYGHGASACARTLEREQVDGLGVATVEEGIELREAGIRIPILVFGGTPPGAEEAVIRARLTPAIWDRAEARALSKAAIGLKQTVKLHVKVDTGMTRLGIAPAEVKAFIQDLSALPGLQTEGIFSHLAQADLADPSVTEGQQRLFQAAVAGVPSLMTHLANSAATVSLGSMGCSMVRPGLMLYGATPADRFREPIALRPVMMLQSGIISLRDVPRGQGVSYGWTFITRRPSRIAALPIGYADGYPRALSNRAFALLHGRRIPVVGAVCMDLTMVDVTDVPAARVGDAVTLIGRDGADQIRVEELASWAGVTPYEILCGIGARVPRVFKEAS